LFRDVTNIKKSEHDKYLKSEQGRKDKIALLRANLGQSQRLADMGYTSNVERDAKRLAKAEASDGEGEWVTINGAHVLIHSDHAPAHLRTFAEFQTLTFTAREEQLPGGAAKWFSQYADEWQTIEDKLAAKLRGIFADQRTQMESAIQRILDAPTKQQQLTAARDIGTRQYGAVKQAIEDAMREAAEMGARQSYGQVGAGKFKGLSPQTVSLIKTEAETVTEAYETNLRLSVKGAVTRGINRELDVKKILFGLADTFDRYEKKIETDLVQSLSPAVNYGGQEVLTETLDDPIMSVTRSERMEGSPNQCGK
jgi:hypothetical protein